MAAQESTKSVWKHRFEVIMDNWTRSEIPQSAAQMTYYALLALVPLLLVAANLIPLLPIDVSVIYSTLQDILPMEIYDIIQPILQQNLESGSGGAISLGVVTALWSASNLINILRRELNSVYGVEGLGRNPIISRILSPLILLAFFVGIAILMFAFVFGEQILLFIENTLNISLPFIGVFLSLRWPVILIVLFIVFLVFYLVVPDFRFSVKGTLPGAIFATLGTVLLSEGFSIYIEFSDPTASNLAFGTFIILMLYLYFAGMIFLAGGLINAVFYELHHDYNFREEVLEEIDGKKKEDYSKDYYQLDFEPIELRREIKIIPEKPLKHQINERETREEKES